MELKDYYKILELPPSATLKEIKSAYRRLAHQFHPDKRNNDLYAAAQFNIIKEAYEVLTDPAKKEHYLQNRWYANAAGQKTHHAPLTPVTILRKALLLDKHISQLDVYRTDRNSIREEISKVLSDENIQTLNRFNEGEINNVIVRTLSKSLLLLPHGMAKELASLLHRVNVEVVTTDFINHNLRKSDRDDKWNRIHPYVIITIVILLCMLIYALSG